jgi:predicted ATPase
LYIESLLEMLQRQNFVSVDKGVARLVSESATSALPDDIRQLVVSRVDQLSPNSQQVIRIAAVLGEEFSVAALQAVAEHLSLEDVEAALVELVEAQILQPGEEGIYRFRHGMTQSVIHETLSRAQRVRLHQSAAAYYRRADNADASPIQAAFHMARNGLQLQAVEWLSTSADASHAAGQPAEALAYLRYALSLEPGDEAIRQRIEHLLGEPDTV